VRVGVDGEEGREVEEGPKRGGTATVGMERERERSEQRKRIAKRR